MGAGCKAKDPNSTGVLPQCPNGKPRISGTITYVNGINTQYPTGKADPFDQDGICKSMQLLANATCAQVIGVYNATGGMARDLEQCLTNIAKNSDSGAVDTLSRSMFAAVSQDPPQDMTVYAHSQGGLITQEALADVKNQLVASGSSPADAEARMQHLSIKSFGTAEEGWPAGPNYEQFTNLADPVPGAISGAQLGYPSQTFSDNANIPNADRHYFLSPHYNPIGPHSIDNVYIKQIIAEKGQPCCCD